MAKGSRADAFILDLEKAFEEQVNVPMKLVTQKLAMEALSRVVLKSPVKTGRFRGNWNVSVGAQDTATKNTTDKSGAGVIAAGNAVINNLTELNIIWVSNSLPYANRLENGYSKQAPGGMVALTFAELATIVKVE